MNIKNKYKLKQCRGLTVHVKRSELPRTMKWLKTIKCPKHEGGMYDDNIIKNWSDEMQYYIINVHKRVKSTNTDTNL